MNNKTDSKIFILFLLNEINYPLDYTTVSDVMTDAGYVEPFDFAECFTELCELGHIKIETVNEEKLYRISESGRVVASELQSELLESIREKSRKSAARLLSLRRRGARLSFMTKKRADGKLDVLCELSDAAGVILSVTVPVSSLEEAKRIRENFENRPEGICRGVLSVLTGDADYYLN